jgi:hypothetical protein
MLVVVIILNVVAYAILAVILMFVLLSLVEAVPLKFSASVMSRRKAWCPYIPKLGGRFTGYGSLRGWYPESTCRIWAF